MMTVPLGQCVVLNCVKRQQTPASWRDRTKFNYQRAAERHIRYHLAELHFLITCHLMIRAGVESTAELCNFPFILQVYSLRTASLTFTNSMFYPHAVFMCFVWISEQTAIISLYNIN